MSAPTPQTVKKLFAVCGNRCAFPKCPQPVVVGKTLLGEICHICAESPQGPRYNPNQTEDERRAFENLLILCPTHHSVIDADMESYTAERLNRMKVSHEAAADRLDPAQVDAGTTLILTQINSQNQSGGITATTVAAHTINMSSQTRPAVEAERIRACTALWDTMLALKDAFSDIRMAEFVFTPEEFQNYFATGALAKHFDKLKPYANRDYGATKMQQADPGDSARLRLFVSSRLWQIFFVYRALTVRLSILVEYSYAEKRYRGWRDDRVFDQHLKALIPAEHLKNLMGRGINALPSILDYLEDMFAAESGAYLLGNSSPS